MATENVLPNSDVTVNWVAQGAGSNYVEVDDPVGTPDDDTTYVYIQDIGTTDELGFPTPTLAGATSINSLTVYSRARRVQATYMSETERIRVDGTAYPGSYRALTGSYVNYSTVWLTNPKTSLAWTVNEVKGTAGTNQLQTIGYASSSMGAGEEQRVTQCYAVIDYNTASGWAHKANGVASPGKVAGVSNANIGKVGGV